MPTPSPNVVMTGAAPTKAAPSRSKHKDSRLEFNIDKDPGKHSKAGLNLHGCTIPGASDHIVDMSDNQAGIFSLASTNSLTGNRVSNSFNGMLLNAGGCGSFGTYDRNVCQDINIQRWRINLYFKKATTSINLYVMVLTAWLCKRRIIRIYLGQY